MYFTKSRITKENYLSLLLALFPISFIAGNMVINLNLFFFLISAIIFFNKKILNLKLQVLDKLIIIFFLFLICNGFISDYNFRQSGIFFEFYPTLLYTPLAAFRSPPSVLCGNSVGFCTR